MAKLVEELELVHGADVEGVAPNRDLEPALVGRGQLFEEGVELGDKEVVGDAGEEGRHESLEGEEGLDGVLTAAVDGADGGVEVVGELVVGAEDGVDELVEVVRGEGVGVLAGAEGVEVAGRGAGAAGAELRVAVGAAVGMAAHGPIATTGNLAAGFVRIAGHGCRLLFPVFSTSRFHILSRLVGGLSGHHVCSKSAGL
jgi:hypothetical protein